MQTQILARALFCAFCSIILFTACQQSAPIKSEPINLYGGALRSNAYEQSPFSGKYVFTDSPRKLHEQQLKSMRSAIPPLLLASGEIVLASVQGEILYMKGDVITKKASTGGIALMTPMVADATDNIFAVGQNGMVYSFTFDGQQRFAVPIFQGKTILHALTPLAQTDGVIFAVAYKQGGEMVKIDRGGAIVWRQTSPITPFGAIAATSYRDDALAILALTFDDEKASDSLIAIDNMGVRRQIWNVAGMRITASPVVVPINTGAGYNILVGGMTDSDGKRLAVLHCLTGTGGTQWSKTLPMLPTGIAVAADGTIIVKGFNSSLSGAEGMVIALDPNGKERWKFALNASSIDSPPMISSNSVAIVATQAEATGVYFIDRVSGKLLNLTSLHDAPIVNSLPMVDASGGMIFSGADRLAIVRVAGNVLERLLPY